MKCELENSGRGGQKTEVKKWKTGHRRKEKCFRDMERREESSIKSKSLGHKNNTLQDKNERRIILASSGCQQRIRNEVKDGRRVL